MAEIIDRVKTRLEMGAEDTSKDPLLNELIAGVKDNIAIRAGAVTFPAVFSSMAVDVVIMAYNRLGSEGLQSESIDVINSSFIPDLLSIYDKQFEEFKKGLSDDSGKGVVFY
ncbi:phage head-tail connector protein [Listeria ilorinensis]|uniref:phage head-tail connector protein n=1 Tax=Listeria ilorinensis TaxID=2867439 RepID=UPI001EF50BA6|nr:phage head-tail connector protein [Listeria ilorinensis]